ncbi:MAG: UDP-glucose 4-epimerase GalE, partial [Geminicoccaceae bacterium]|nr:UDP-glucose 4-epimerase GalE [Geminicoccaceae bacterium]
LEACVEHGISAFVLSSTAAVYGVPLASPVAEDAAAEPINPYGWSKLMAERVLRDAAAAHDLPFLILRYFNVAGADPRGRAGPSQTGPAHLLKIAIEAALGRRADVPIYGSDYPTTDGTCIRDFIHVSDLAAAHVAGLDYLLGGGPSTVLNCGYGRGYSVREVLATVERVAGRRIATRLAPRRPRDPPEVVADAERIRILLGWQPRFDDLEKIVAHSLAWLRRSEPVLATS